MISDQKKWFKNVPLYDMGCQ